MTGSKGWEGDISLQVFFHFVNFQNQFWVPCSQREPSAQDAAASRLQATQPLPTWKCCLPARSNIWVFLLSGTLSDLSQGCIPKNFTIFPTASVGRNHSINKPHVLSPLCATTTPPSPNPAVRGFKWSCIWNMCYRYGPRSLRFREEEGRWGALQQQPRILPSSVLMVDKVNVSSFSNSSPTSSQAASKFSFMTFWMWSAIVTSRSSSWGDRDGS